MTPLPLPLALTIDLDVLADAVAARLPASSGGGASIWHANSGNGSERVTGLTVSPITQAVIYSVPVPDLQVGDLLVVLGEFEVTNDLGYNCMCGSQLVLSETAGGPLGTEISEANTMNVDPIMHHYTKAQVGTLVVTATNRTFVNLVGWAGSTAAAAGDVLKVEQDYGRLSVLRIRQ